jgi:RNA polymerase sigma factor (sigma-70 family)
MLGGMPSSTVRALVDQALLGGGNDGVADDRARDQAKAAAMSELLRLAERVLDELAAPLAGQRWPDRSVSDLRNLVLLQFSKRLADFRGENLAELRGWLRTILENTQKNFHRHAAARRPVNGMVHSLESLLEDSVSWRHDIEPAAGDLSVSRPVQLQEALDRLDPLDRRILELRYGEGLTMEEVARRVGRHERTVRRDIERLLKLLRGEVEPPR